MYSSVEQKQVNQSWAFPFLKKKKKVAETCLEPHNFEHIAIKSPLKKDVISTQKQILSLLMYVERINCKLGHQTV